MTAYHELEPTTMPASIKLELASRVARKQSEKSFASHKQSHFDYLSRRTQQGLDVVDYHDAEEDRAPELLSAGSLRL